MGGFIPAGFERIDVYVREKGLDNVGPLLAAGTLEAFRVNAWGEIHLIDRSTWRGSRAKEILTTGKTGDRHHGRFDANSGDRVLVRIPKEAAAVPPQQRSVPKLVYAASTSSPTRGGAPLKHDWAAAAGWIAGHIVENDYPKTQADLVKVAVDWFKDGGKLPDKRDIERFVKAIYEARKHLNGKTGKM